MPNYFVKIFHVMLGDVSKGFKEQSFDLKDSHLNMIQFLCCSFMWSCRPVTRLEGKCFNDSMVNQTTLLMDAPVLEVNASWLIVDEEEFVFNLTVSAPGSEPAYSTQVVRVKSDRPVIP